MRVSERWPQNPRFPNAFPHHATAKPCSVKQQEQRKVTATSVCPCSSKEFLWLTPPCALSHPRLRKGLCQFSLKLSYLFLHQILYEELTRGLAAMTNQGNIICPSSYHNDNRSTVGNVNTVRKRQKVAQETSPCCGEETVMSVQSPQLYRNPWGTQEEE